MNLDTNLIIELKPEIQKVFEKYHYKVDWSSETLHGVFSNGIHVQDDLILNNFKLEETDFDIEKYVGRLRIKKSLLDKIKSDQKDHGYKEMRTMISEALENYYINKD